MVVLDGAPLERTVTGALWAAFAGGGRHRAAVGRLVVVPSVAEAAARRRSWPAPSACTPATRAAPTPRSARCARPRPASGSRSWSTTRSPTARRCCAAARSTSPASTGAFYAPAVLRGVKPGARILREPVPGPVLAVVEAADEDEAIALAKRAPAVSVWAGDRARGERVARELEADVAWVNEHGHSIPDAAVRLAGHVESRRIASQPTRLRSARWLPYDPQLVRAATASARLDARPRDRAAARAAHRRACRWREPRCGWRERRSAARPPTACA